ncbi:NAD dependent epimerase/dehydratase family protein [Halogranum amylolyticum]|uniref:NAD dependent epimerase/dehydratase family protein n=2 Tax=Halogranum amylolyticum TaxID=660520 RepID=A0A1H8WU08_9EURY|nr:NAD dependent epimerase/dehydratase family protein [Halogranum amylolyticum]
MAVMIGVHWTLENPLGVRDVNMDRTHNVLTAAADADVNRVLFAPTSEEYGDLIDPPYLETTDVSPKTNYPVAKLADKM